MKRFLKRANRGLILGAFAIVVLVIYIVVDYSNFNSEKPKIKEDVENYIGDFYNCLEKNDLEALKKHVKDSWTGEPVMQTSYYEDKNSMLTLFDQAEAQNPSSKYGEITYTMDEMSIKKSGPNMAYVTVKFTASIEYGCCADIIEPFCPYVMCWYYSEEQNDDRYVYEMDFEGSLYLRKEDGEWKISQSDVWSTSCMPHAKEGE